MAFERLSTADRERALRLLCDSFAREEFAPLSDETLNQIADDTLIELDRSEWSVHVTNKGGHTSPCGRL
ncbi:MAG: hypothetical protein DCC68_02020 [Planctomycetota bacterium]|nr:MAG: hypothetical protein DCC68_02020 [Planctomycetota bacterium]